MSFFVKAVVLALKEVPALNSRIDGDELVENHFYDVGVAVGTDKGLVVPVVRDADQKSFAEIEQDIVETGAGYWLHFIGTEVGGHDLEIEVTDAPHAPVNTGIEIDTPEFLRRDILERAENDNNVAIRVTDDAVRIQIAVIDVELRIIGDRIIVLDAPPVDAHIPGVSDVPH